MSQLFCQDKNIVIRRSFRSKYLRLSVNRKGTISVSAPLFCFQRDINQFIEKHTNWIEEQLKKIKPKFEFQNGKKLTILGEEVVIDHNPNYRITEIRSGKLCIGGEACFMHRRCETFIKKKTYEYIYKKAEQLAFQIGKKIHRITLKDTTSRWGSCSQKKNLNFSWRLGLAPTFVLDYIIAHEVAHLQEMNHGPRFWHLVGTLTNQRADAEIWLRRHGSELHSF